MELNHPDGLVQIRQAAPYATVHLLGLYDTARTRSEGWRVLQESLDALAASHRLALETADGDSSHLLWMLNGQRYDLVCVDTAHLPMSFGGGFVGAPAPATSSAMARDDALRFYRLSQASDDLFDAYRNAYLALECLASAATPKGASEKELHWLQRAVAGPLGPAIPAGLISSTTIEDIYLKGRLPLFHAKSGSLFYSPHGEERQVIYELFATLSELVARLLKHKLGHSAVALWASISQDMYDAMAAPLFDFDEMELTDGSTSVRLPVTPRVVSSPRRYGQLWCQATVKLTDRVGSLVAIKNRKSGQEHSTCTLNEAVPLANVDSVQTELSLIQYGKGAPKQVHPR